ncbi:DUF2807 domain-containing protein [Sphingomonas gilva]|uniref:DUF2807 domain-containing protein n=1 Tax=Sphingomonas gilva TaxID=2305907 RepID=A0A396RQ31_9SPHN|nr:head GIN domain-containing protein [Sphingomonas gilva]RHW18677.1 DUF2807 domain-containing protein [Sphingomonas gilva]
MLTRLVLLLLLLAAPAAAAERSYSVTDFDRIRVEGPFRITVTTGSAVTARAEGDQRALDGLVLRVDGRTLVVRMGDRGWGGYPGETPPPPSIRLTAPNLRAAVVTGGAVLDISAMKAPRVDLTLTGSGSITAPAIEADRLVASLMGTGRLVMGGRALIASVQSRGAGDIDASALAVGDLTVNSESAGEAKFNAERSVRVVSLGAGAISVAGDAACTVQSTGVGPVACNR